MSGYVVVRVTEDAFRGTTVESFGPFFDSTEADRYRRKLLATEADRYPWNDLKVQVARMEDAR